MAYNPLKDSNLEGATRLATLGKFDGGPLIVIEPGECWCGCHERPARGRRFKPGHDTRFRGIIGRARDAHVPVTVVQGGERQSHTAEWWLAELVERPEAEAVRRRDARRRVRRAKEVLAWDRATDGMTRAEIVAAMLAVDPGLTAEEAGLAVDKREAELDQLKELVSDG